ncbi:MAG: PDZ domain-containing protein [Anaerolineae bacterium]|nr:PDZ domain-containing protein [Anaerolineae bacterium]
MNRLTRHHLWLNLAAAITVAMIGVGAMSVYANDQNVTSGVNAQEDDTRAYLGVQIASSENGVEVMAVDPNSPANEAGIEVGDIIQQVDETVIDTANQLSEYISTKAPGDAVTVTLLRGEETLTVEATLAEAPSGVSVPSGNRPGGRDGSEGRPFVYASPMGYQLGVSFKVITPEIAASEGLSVEDGALITEVVEDSPAADAGLQVGDIITAVDGDKVDVEHTLSDRLYAYEAEDQVTLTVVRGGETLEVSAVLAAGHPGRIFEGTGGMNFGPNGLPLGNGNFPFGDGQNFPFGNDIKIPFDGSRFSGDMETITCSNEEGTIQFQMTVPKGLSDSINLPDSIDGANITCERTAADDSDSGSGDATTPSTDTQPS